MPTVSEPALRTFDGGRAAKEPTHSRAVRLTSQAHSRPPACQLCQQRKRKCDRKRPTCGMCQKHDQECIVDIKITDKSHPNFLTDLLAELEERTRRVNALEALLRARLPELAGVNDLSTDQVTALSISAEPLLHTGDAPMVSYRSATPPFYQAPISQLPGPASPPPPLPSLSPPRLRSITPIHDGCPSATDVEMTAVIAASTDVLRLPSADGLSPPPDDSPQVQLSPVASTSALSSFSDPGATRLSPRTVQYIENRLQLLESSRRSARHPAVVSLMCHQLGAEDLIEDSEGEVTTTASWPPYELAIELIDIVLASNAIYPVFRRARLLKDLDEVYGPRDSLGNPDERASPLQTFTLFLLFSIGSVWGAQRDNGNRVDTSLLRHRALSSLSTLLRTESSVTCISALFLLAFTAIYDWGGLNLIQITPVVAEVAQKSQLHRRADASLSQEERDDRSVLFWSIYCLERAMGGTGTTVVFDNDEDVTVELPKHVDSMFCVNEAVDAASFFAHTVAMRRLMWELSQLLQSSPTPETVASLRGRLEEWYAASPRAENDTRESLFDLYYDMMLAKLYAHRDLAIVKKAASDGLAVIRAVKRKGDFRDNFFHLNNVLILAVTLVYALSQYAMDPAYAADAEWCQATIDEVEAVRAHIAMFCRGWPYAASLSRAFNVLAARLTRQLSKPHATPQADAASPQAASTDLYPAYSDIHLPFQNEAFWDAWLSGGEGPLQGGWTEGGPSEIDVDALMGMVGWPPEWLNDA